MCLGSLGRVRDWQMDFRHKSKYVLRHHQPSSSRISAFRPPQELAHLQHMQQQTSSRGLVFLALYAELRAFHVLSCGCAQMSFFLRGGFGVGISMLIVFAVCVHALTVFFH